MAKSTTATSAAPTAAATIVPGSTSGALTLAALGVVYGDIGTSPLYAFRECLRGPHGVEPTPASVLGVLSLIFWALVAVVSLKYIALVMRADNRGEGGILALMALAHPLHETQAGRRVVIIMLGLLGASLLYGDGMITPAISVLSAIEGLEIATPSLASFVVPLTIVVVIALFAIQRHGTGKIGAVFGPLMLTWFLAIGVLGAWAVLQDWRTLLAINPLYAARFVAHNGLRAVLVLGTVFLAVTGAEALYADMGHFGRGPIRRAWFGIVFPALLLNYFGQGALLLREPAAAANPFYYLAPAWATYPLIGLATIATVIASQAVISGAFSLTHQAVQLGFMPRVRIQHTSEEEIGQIYVPVVNWILFVAVLGLVIAVESSSGLAGAYGVAVSTTMVITTVLAYVVMRRRWGWSMANAGLVTSALLTMDGAFLAGNAAKILDGGWFPLAVGVIGYAVMSTWRRGRAGLVELTRKTSVSLDELLRSLKKTPPTQVDGTAVFLTADPEGIPSTLLHNLKHNKILHRLVIFLTFVTEEVPRIATQDRVRISIVGERFYRVTAHYGFMQSPHLPAILARCHAQGLAVDLDDVTVFVGRQVPFVQRPFRPWHWRMHLFAFLARNTASLVTALHVRPEWIVELGARVRL